jgi:hypothetical protein
MARVQDLFGSIYNICISLLASLDALTFFLADSTSAPAPAGLAFWIGLCLSSAELERTGKERDGKRGVMWDLCSGHEMNTYLLLRYCVCPFRVFLC